MLNGYISIFKTHSSSISPKSSSSALDSSIKDDGYGSNFNALLLDLRESFDFFELLSLII
jgi:hypothetical protein